MSETDGTYSWGDRPFYRTFTHGKRAQSRTGETRSEHTSYYTELKKEVYKVLSEFPSGQQISIAAVYDMFSINEQYIHDIIFIENFGDGNPAGIRVERSKGGIRKVFKI